MKTKKAYFIGIAGKAIGQLAKALKDQGWEVSGSDHVGVYPPVSTYLQENNIPYFEGYRPENVPPKVDLVVVGRSALMVDPQNPEYVQAKKLKCPVLSFPEVLQKYLIKEKSIVVAGTYGKTTISALLVWIFLKAGLDPAYMTGGISLNFKDGVKITDSPWSIVEGDEPPALAETDPPKFMFYQPSYLLLTATIYDHPEIFKSEEEYRKAFVDLVGLLPADGLLVYENQNVSPKIIDNYSGQKISYSASDTQADFSVKNIKHSGNSTEFEVVGKGNRLKLVTTLLGKHNLENICGAVALCLSLGLDKKKIADAVFTFKGVKTRLEYLGSFTGRDLYWDFAQHPEKIKGSLQALRERHLDNRIFCVFDPSMTGLKYRESLAWYRGAFDLADRVIVGKVGFLRELKGKNRVGGSEVVKAIAETQKNVSYEPDDEKIIQELTADTWSGDIIVFMSSGGLRFTKLIENAKQRLSKIN